MKFPLLFLATLLAITPATMAAERLKILIIDGQNNHDWRASTPHLRKVLETSGRFTVEVATTPGKGGDMKSFQPKFDGFAAVLSNYNG
jgi:uncharacterized protein